MAEAYWDQEWTLQQQGFDYCYDKRLYDRLEHDNGESVKGHLQADLQYQDGLIRFIENHDEPRAAATFTPDKARAAAVVIATTPGAKLLHEGQFEGRRVRVPVFLARRPDEPVDPLLRAFYIKLLQAVKNTRLLSGEWQMSNVYGWPDNQSYRNILSWNWQQGNKRVLIVINLSDWKSQAQVHVPWSNSQTVTWHLTDLLSNEVFEREGRDLDANGLYVDMHPWQFYFLQFR
jgi:hypothetical protein